MHLLLLSLISSAAAMYSKTSPVIQLNSKNFDAVVQNTDKITFVEFFAPWCGHCQKLAPAYEKVADGLKGIVNIAAVDCDDGANKPLCGKYDIKGFPTIKIMLPEPDKQGKRTVRVEEYRGERTVAAISDFATRLMPSRVEKLKSGSIKEFLAKANDTVKVVLFTKKGVTSSVYKSLSTSFKDASFAQVRNDVSDAVELFGITTFPQLLVLPGGDAEAVIFTGKMKLGPMRDFIATYTKLTEEAANPVEEETKKKAAAAESFLQFDKFDKADDLEAKCLTGEHKKPCVLVAAPLLTEINFKIKQKEFRFAEYSAEAAVALTKASIPTDKAVFVHGKKGWYLTAEPFTTSRALQDWIDQVKAGELSAAKVKLTLTKDEL
jgi:protein disulfide-isomerase A6